MVIRRLYRLDISRFACSNEHAYSPRPKSPQNQPELRKELKPCCQRVSARLGQRSFPEYREVLLAVLEVSILPSSRTQLRADLVIVSERAVKVLL